MIVKKLKILLISYIFSSFFVNAEESPGGLLFTSSKEKVDKRTSLVLFGDKIQKFENKFEISFDLSIWDSGQFGHIFHLINDRKQEVEFVFVNFYGTDSMYLDFHSPITHKSVQIPIIQEDIDKKTTLNFNIIFDLKADSVTIIQGNNIYTCKPVGLENPSYLQLAFGLYGLNLDVPQMLIKDLHIRQDKGKSFFFPMGESEGELVYDKTEKNKAPVKNPEWIVNKHFYWQLETTFTVSNKASVNYDEENNCILITFNDSLLSFFPRYEKIRWNKLNPDFVSKENIGENNSLHSNIFFSKSKSGDMYRFGGYSNHSYSNKISLYNAETGKWETVEFEGDYITPRFYSAVGDGIGNDEILLFGGFGNETGKQEHGGQNLYDLYVLNLDQKTITRLWSMKETLEMEFIPSSDLILSEDKKYFYALCYSHHIPKTYGYLYRFDLQSGAYSVISDSISLTSEDMNTSVNLFYNSQINEFYAVISDLSDENDNRVRVYSLLSPPITKTQLDNSVHRKKSYAWIFLPAILIFLTGIYLLWFLFYRKKKDTKNKELLEILHLPYKIELEQKQKHSAVYIFGKFTVFDRKGMDISYRFSMKLRALFSLVLLNTDGETGITTESLTQSLWPDKDVNGGKNIRGVTINRLRGILEDIDGISLVHQNHRWFFIFEEPFYCDWLEYSNILQSLYTSVELKQYNEYMEQLVAIVGNGTFLANVQDRGIDDYKSDEEEKLGQILNDYIMRLYGEKQYRKVILTAPAFFAIEPLNDKILNICIKSYDKLGKKADAKAFLKNYKRTHKMMTGEEFKE